MKWVIIILFFIALLSDVYIYRSVITAVSRRLPARMIYILYSVITNGTAVTVFLLYNFSSDQSPGAMLTILWITWAFFMTATPKVLFMAGGLIDSVVSWIFRRRAVFFRSVAILLGLASVIYMIYGATAGRSDIRVEEIEIRSDRIPSSFDGYRIVQFSDLHLGTMPKPEKHLPKIVDAINELAPDLVVHTGDLVNIYHTDLTSSDISILSDIGSVDGVWNVWGNHDLGFYIKDTVSIPLDVNLVSLEQKVARMGWKNITDSYTYIKRGADSLMLAGVNYPKDWLLNSENTVLAGVDLYKVFEGADPDAFSIVFSHTPQLWREITGLGFGDLTLSGHIHSMQFKIILFGRPWSPAKFLFSEWSGIYVENKEKINTLYINDGIGCVGYPMRIGATPESTLFILKSCE